MATGSDAVPELSTVRVRMGIVGRRRGMDRLMGQRWLRPFVSATRKPPKAYCACALIVLAFHSL